MPLGKKKKRLFLRRPKNKGAPSHEARAALRRNRRLLHNLLVQAGSRNSTEKSNNAVTSGNGVDQEFASHDQDLTVDMGTNSDSTPFLGFDVIFQAKPLRVLSLFDGVSSGLLALDSLGIRVSHYFSSEIDADALAIQRKRFHGRITEIGCVTKCNEQLLDQIAPIDLLIGGSPCSQLSRVNPKRKIFAKGSSGRLFFNYIDVLKYLKEKARDNHQAFHYLFENTANLDKSTRVTMTEKFNEDPQMIDAKNFVPMRRKRLFWHNMGASNVDLDSISIQPLQSFLDPGRKANVKAVSTITTSSACQMTKGKLPVIDFDGTECRMNVNELERLFHFGEGFTDNGKLSISRRTKLIGNSWVVPVISYVLNPLVKFLENDDP